MNDYFTGDDRSQRERMLAGDSYIADDPKLEQLSKRAIKLADNYARAMVSDHPEAQSILRELLGAVGDDVVVRPPFYVDYGSNLFIGNRTFINFNLTALDIVKITMGEDCQIGPNVQLLTATHPLGAQPRRDKIESSAPITLGDNVWLGGGVIVCPGVTIGDNSVIGAGAVVTKDIPANVVAVGNPARVVKSIND